MFLSLATLFLVALQAPVVGQKLNGSLTAPNGRVNDAYLSGEYVVYHALQDGTASGLYTTKLEPNNPLTAGGRVVLFRARPGEVVYLADQDTRGVLELYYSTFP